MILMVAKAERSRTNKNNNNNNSNNQQSDVDADKSRNIVPIIDKNGLDFVITKMSEVDHFCLIF